jgi:arginine/lysine/ornithine decarboxylase
MHKTLNGLTQAGFIHLTAHARNYLQADQVRACLGTVQTSSPSYVLMSAVEQAVVFLDSDEGLFRLRQMQNLATRINRTSGIEIYQTRFADDPAHLLIAPQRGSAQSLYDFLIEQGIFAEAILGAGVLLLLGSGSESIDIIRLTDAIDEYVRSDKAGPGQFGETVRPAPRFAEIEQVLSPRQAFLMPSQVVPLEEAVGRIAVECIAPCPPGIPICVPGQKLTDNILESLTDTRNIRVVSN